MLGHPEVVRVKPYHKAIGIVTNIEKAGRYCIDEWEGFGEFTNRVGYEAIDAYVKSKV